MSFLSSLNPFAHVSKDKQEQKNMAYSGAKMVLLSGQCALPGNIQVNFQNSIGITPERSAAYQLPSSILLPLAMLLVAPFLDRVNNRLKLYALATLAPLASLAHPLLICLGPDSFRTADFVLISGMFFSCLFAIANCPNSGIDAAVACRVIHNNVRGRFLSIGGMASGIFGVLVGLYATWIAKTFSYRMALLLACIPSVILCIFSALLVLKLKELPDLIDQAPVKRQSPFKDLAKIIGMKEFRVMMPANFLRGLGDGAASYAFWIVLKKLNLAPEYAGYVTILTTVAPFIGFGILGVVMDRFGAGIVIPVSDILMVIGLMGTIMTQSPILFLCFFLLRLVMYNVESAAVPLAHYEVVPNEVMGSFSSLRLLLLMLTSSLSGVISGMLLACLSPFAVFAGSAVIKLVSGALYCYGVFALRKHVKPQPAKAS